MQYNASNRLHRHRDTGDGNVWRNYAYDSRGNVTNNGTIGFTYDRAERPVSISGGASGSFTYDAHGRRVKQVVGGQTIYSVYSAGGTLLYRDNATTGAATDYIRMGGRAIARVRGSDVEWTYADHLGSPAAAASQTGAILWREDHTPFGEARQSPAGNADNEGFTGHIADAASGLVYMQARYYDPVVGRFLSSDPVGFSQGGVAYFNRYVYAFNDPVSFTDPTGMCGTRRDDGTCEVTIDADIADFELARNAASALENQLNALDPMVNALSDDAQLQWTDSNNSTHTISGAEFKHAWNNTSWNVGSRPPDNGGVGEAFPGGVNITAAGLAGYVRWGEAGLNYLVFHDVGGHLTPPGLAMQALQWGNFVSANPNLTRDELNANYPSSSYYVANERFANQAALTIANRLNVPILGNPAHGY